jgi:hypothetical protein
MTTDAIQTFTDYERGRREAFEEAAGMLEMSDATIRLHCGEMTAQEMRTVKAVLKWKAAEMRDEANG